MMHKDIEPFTARTLRFTHGTRFKMLYDLMLYATSDLWHMHFIRAGKSTHT